MGELGEGGLHVLAMFHPVIELDGARRSLIQVWLEPVGEARRERLVADVRAVLADVSTAVADTDKMRALLSRAIADLEVAQPTPGVWNEEAAFLRWLEAGNFIFLGARVYDYPRTAAGDYAPEEPLYQPEDSLGVLRDPSRAVLRRGSEPAILSAALQRRLEHGEPVVVAKSNLRSRVHRRVYMDYIGVRRFGAGDRPSGEVRFVGLFTLEAYEEPARDIPLLRRKLQRVMDAAGFLPGSHNAIRLANIIENFPRDELFQISDGELRATAIDILHLFDRPRVKMFVRVDPFDRFVSVLLYVPRERYDSRLRSRVGEMLASAYQGRVSAYYPHFSDSPLARVQFIIGVTPGAHPEPDLNLLEARIARAARTWSDDLEVALRRTSGVKGGDLLAAYADAFPAGYRDRYDADEAVRDLEVAQTVAAGEDSIAVRAFRTPGDPAVHFRFKLYRAGLEPARLARVTPILADMGLSALVEEGHAIRPRVRSTSPARTSSPARWRAATSAGSSSGWPTRSSSRRTSTGRRSTTSPTP